MASLIVIVTYCLLLFLSLSSATRLPPDATPSVISQACRATRYPEICESSLAKAPPNPNPTQIVSSAISVSAEMVQEILESPDGNPNVSTAAERCVEVLRKSAYRTQLATDALTRGKIRDVRAWMSASLLYQNDCFSSLVSVNSTLHVNEIHQMIVEMAHLQSLINRTSNALSILMAYENFGNNVGSWKPPATERDGFWEVRSGSGAVTELGFPKGLTPDVTVCKMGGGKCNYEKVQEAVDAAPENLTAGKRFVIAIKEGVYEEIVRVPLDKTNLVFLGDGIGKTVITGSRHSFQPEVTTYTSATVAVVGDGFMASGLTIQNTASGNVDQAVAFRSESDRSIIENCEFIGNQDTLYAYSLRQFYKYCVIQGNLDFIFGNAAAVFQDCTILIRPRQVNPEYGERNAVTAHARTDPAQTTGFVFHNCSVRATDEYVSLINKNPPVHKNFLGRPWKEYARTIFIHCHLEAFISPKGWRNWVGEHALKTLHYGEFENFGPGAVTEEREPWSSQIPPERVSTYSVQNFIQGDEWVSK